jgi:hypothetical protein
MNKRILIVLLALVLIFTAIACNKKEQNQNQNKETKVTQTIPRQNDDPVEPLNEPTESAEEPIESFDLDDTELDYKFEPGIEVPVNWPLEVPSPMTGEVLGCGWSNDKSFCTTDIVYKQEDIDSYGKRLEKAGFKCQEEHKYGEMWPDAKVYSNGKWDVLVAQENDTFDYSYVNFYPLFDVVNEGYEGQPEGWPESGNF